MKKLTSLLLVLALIATMTSGAIAAPAHEPLTMDRLTLTVPTLQDIARLPRLPEGSPRVTYTSSLADAADVLREAMVQRQAVCDVYVCTDDYSDENLQNIADDILIYAMLHTGEPNEGDYLIWNFSGGSVSLSDYFFQGDLAMLTYTYELEYLTTAQQEQQVDAKVSQLVDGLDGMTDYEKLLSVYTYVCENVTAQDVSGDLDLTAYGALIQGSATSIGFSVTMYRLALELGIDCHTIIGTVKGSEHYWNIAQIGDLYYNLDATLDAGNAQPQYFLRSDASFASHKRDSIFDSEDYREFYPMAQKDYCPHDYAVEPVPPTCTDPGYDVYTCTLCGEGYTLETTAALGHTYGQWEKVADPVCTADGRYERSCVTCGQVEKKYISTLGHDYKDGECTICGKELEAGLTVPAAPTILSCYSRVQTSVKTTWEIMDGVDGYELWRSTDPDDPAAWSRVKTVSSTAPNCYTNQGLTRGVTYYYKVRAYVTASDGSKVYSDFSEVDYMPAAVIFDGPYSNSTSQIRLRWKQIGGSHGYQIWRQQSDGSWKIVKTLGDKGNVLTNDQGSAVAYTNTGLSTGDTYVYRMRAFMITEDGRKIFGAYSDEITVAVMPEAPTLQATSPRATRAQLTWDSVYGASGYQVWMSTDPNDGFKIVKSITDSATSYTKYDLVSGQTYYFKLRAYAEVDGRKTFGAYSQTIAVTIQ